MEDHGSKVDVEEDSSSLSSFCSLIFPQEADGYSSINRAP